MVKKGVLAIVSGFSGVGKGTVVDHMKKIHPFTLSVSATTRDPRPGEVEGKSYFFITEDDFKAKAEQGWFLEWAQYTKGSYGTPKQPVLDALSRGEDVLLEIEAQGARQVKEQYPDALLIFVLPPTFAELYHRLTGRGTETKEAIESRLQRAMEEFREIPGYDAVVVNETIEGCADEILSLMEARRTTPAAQKAFIDGLEEEAKRFMEALQTEKGE